jgi:hypothetical protein
MAKKNLINADMLLATPRKAPEKPYAIPEPEISTVEESYLISTYEIVDIPDHPVEPEPTTVSSVKRGLKGSETRATFIVDENLLEKLKAVAYWDRLNIKEVINEVFQNYIDQYEKQNGSIKAVPRK